MNLAILLILLKPTIKAEKDYTEIYNKNGIQIRTRLSEDGSYFVICNVVNKYMHCGFNIKMYMTKNEIIRYCVMWTAKLAKSYDETLYKKIMSSL